jgi:PIN domain nuclease of toxin-antitoxin system
VTVFVLDSSALLCFIDKETGWNRMAAILQARMDQTVEIAISAVQWGEIAGRVRKKLGASGQNRAMEILAEFRPRIVAANGERAVRAASIKVDRKFAYAGAFALDPAMDSAGQVPVTADYDFKAVDDPARIELLPVK